jgi:hypothetical protein
MDKPTLTQIKEVIRRLPKDLQINRVDFELNGTSVNVLMNTDNTCHIFVGEPPFDHKAYYNEEVE